VRRAQEPQNSVRWAGIAVEDEDSFVIEGEIGGLPRDMGGADALGIVLLLLREALAMRRKLVGDEHADVADSLCHLAFALEHQVKLAEAEAMAALLGICFWRRDCETTVGLDRWAGKRGVVRLPTRAGNGVEAQRAASRRVLPSRK
jgi:hypothetical protein